MAGLGPWCGIGAPLTDRDGDVRDGRRHGRRSGRWGHIPNSRAPLPAGDRVARTRVALVWHPPTRLLPGVTIGSPHRYVRSP
ncbi:hypothetical protein PYK79_08790 [Streptomyces sp. ID05-04B]|nr:hypothetical protein [Streptomyces sp. ID05-04B]